MCRIILLWALIIFSNATEAQETGRRLYKTSGFEFYYIETASSNYAGIADKNGKIIIPISRKYDYIYYSSINNKLGFFMVEKIINGEFYKGACDMSGKEIIPIKYASLYYSSSENCFRAKTSRTGSEIKINYTFNTSSNNTSNSASSSSLTSNNEYVFTFDYCISGGIDKIYDKTTISLSKSGKICVKYRNKIYNINCKTAYIEESDPTDFFSENMIKFGGSINLTMHGEGFFGWEIEGEGIVITSRSDKAKKLYNTIEQEIKNKKWSIDYY